MIKSPKMDWKDNDAVDKYKRKCSERIKQHPSSDEHAHRFGREAVLSHASKLTSKEVETYNKALKELIAAVSHPLQFECSFDRRDERRQEHTPSPLEDTQHLFTETDVTLPSCVDGSQDTEPPAGNMLSRRAGGLRLLSSSCQSSPDLDKVCQELMTIYEQLKDERVSHREWERELRERERSLEEREGRLGEREEALGRLSAIEETLNSCVLSVRRRHQREVRDMQELLGERVGENKRLRSSFNTMKELNHSMKKQLKELGEHNAGLESRCKRVQGRLENLQRKYDHSVAGKARLNACVKATESGEPSGRGRAGASGKPTNKGPAKPAAAAAAAAALLALIMDWLLETQPFATVERRREAVRDGPPRLPPDVLLTDRCLQMLPLLADQLQQMSSAEAPLFLCVLRFTYWSLRHLDGSPQRVALSCTLRRIGAQVSTHLFHDHDDDDGGGGGGGGGSDHVFLPGSHGDRGGTGPHARVLMALITLHTVTRADLLARALAGLRGQLRSEGSRGLFLQYGGPGVLLRLLRANSGGGPHAPVDILMQLSAPSRFLDPFLEACSCEDFFSTISRLLQQPHLDLPLLEKLSTLLQKLSNIRRNRRLFERWSLHLLLEEMHRTSDPTRTFLRLNLSSILLNLER